MSELKLEKINELTVRELMQLCKENNLPCYNGKNRKTKRELIDQILDYVKDNDLIMVETDVEEINSEDILDTVDIPVGVEDKITNDVGEGIQLNNDIPPVKEYKPWEFKNRDVWIECSEPGTLMAFLDLKGKPRTAALINRSSKNRKVKLQTEFGMEFVVPYENVLWVKRSKRWPRGIYNLLKGIC